MGISSSRVKIKYIIDMKGVMPSYMTPFGKRGLIFREIVLQ
jgi:hypothetical protein